MFASKLKIAGIVLLFFAAGASLTKCQDENYLAKIYNGLTSPELYVTPDMDLRTRLSNSEIKKIGWRDLLPNADQEVLEKYQSSAEKSLSE
tara:strand:+ start:2051 stop:2323 length:273 start_codon:yes stop_codon:yes gene_type:complete